MTTRPKTRLLRRHRLALAATTAIVALGLVAAASPPDAQAVPVTTSPVSAAPSDLGQVRARILADTNAARAAAGLAPLTADVDLDGVAQACSENQAAANLMAHCSGFSSRYPTGWTWAGENVAKGYRADAVVTAWMNSPGHRANILRADATHLGIGFARAADGSTYYTQNFAAYPNRPRAGCADAPDLASGATAVYRFWSPAYQGHFYTISRSERDGVIAQWPGVWQCEGPAYYAFPTQQPGTVPLYRFWSAQYRGHFYTVDPAERDAVISQWSGVWTYEGAVYYVYPPGSSAASTTAVYRFWSPSGRHHFYTSSVTERDGVIATWSSVWSYEGEVFRVPR